MTTDIKAKPRLTAEAKKVWASIGKSAGTRILILPISAILGIVCTRLIVDNYGAAAYAQFGLLVGLGSLLPFADLGLSAVIMNAVAESPDPATDESVRQVLITSVRLLFMSAFVILLVSLSLTLLGAWPALLGGGLLPGAGPIAAALCLCAIASALPFGIGQRILSGLGKNHMAIALMGLQSPIVLIVFIVLIRTKLDSGPWLPIVPYLATMLLSIAATFVAGRKISPAVRSALRSAPHFRTIRGGKVFHVAWPMLIQMIALPIAMQTDRIILSHVATPATLAEYNLASQMYTPIWGVTSAAGLALWPIFARERAGHASGRTSPIRLAVIFGLVAAAITVTISLAAPWLAGVASGGAIRLNTSVLVAFSALMIFQAAKVPLGMFMTDSRGLQYQAYLILIMLPINLGLSWMLAVKLGTVGPVLGSAAGVLLCQVLANWWYVRRQLIKQSEELDHHFAGTTRDRS